LELVMPHTEAEASLRAAHAHLSFDIRSSSACA
jgi:hypothetical protein